MNARTLNTPRYELCYSPTDGEVLIYRSIPAGISGPFSETVPCESREQAIQFANKHGYRQAGEWEPCTNYDALPLRAMSWRASRV